MAFERKAVLFVCLGNICRSPTAQAVFKKRSKDAGLSVWSDSAGTGAWHAGETPDKRAISAGRARGYSFAGQFARGVEDTDFEAFDLILAMDTANLNDLRDVCPEAFQNKLKLFLDYAPHTDMREVPDPYYGGEDGFDRVLDLIEIASEGLIKELKKMY
ncbi:MAG: protein-tyrosine-phosphatase [Robiginitomaculum sp.]|nr:MAG: protein-tyrosine-phosphatase [Robiginitomaculum sp.]